MNSQSHNAGNSVVAIVSGCDCLCMGVEGWDWERSLWRGGGGGEEGPPRKGFTAVKILTCESGIKCEPTTKRNYCG